MTRHLYFYRSLHLVQKESILNMEVGLRFFFFFLPSKVKAAKTSVRDG